MRAVARGSFSHETSPVLFAFWLISLRTLTSRNWSSNRRWTTFREQSGWLLSIENENEFDNGLLDFASVNCWFMARRAPRRLRESRRRLDVLDVRIKKPNEKCPVRETPRQ